MTILRSLAAACALSLALAVPAVADAEPTGAPDARAVIQMQLDAFEAEAVDEAYEYAAPNVQRMFPTPGIFGRMVQRGYPMVWDPAQAEFLDARPLGSGLVQRLRFVDRKGQPYIAEYMMMRVEGEWRIAGVSITRDESFGV